MLKQFGYAPGNYMCKCMQCGKSMINVDKRAVVCFECAENLADIEHKRLQDLIIGFSNYLNKTIDKL